MDDNLSLTEEIKERYRSMYSGVFYDRYIKGLWSIAEGVIYDMFDATKHVIKNITGLVGGQKYVSIDYGTQNATVFLLWERILKGNGYVLKNTITVAEKKRNRKRIQSMLLTLKNSLMAFLQKL